MGQEILYCYKCSTRVVGTDFDKGEAFQVGNHTACKACAQELLALLPPAEREALRARMSRAASEKSGSSTRMPKISDTPRGTPRAGDTPRSTPRVAVPAAPPATGGPSKTVLLAIGGAALLAILLAFAMSGGNEHSVARPDPGAAERAERETAARREQDKEAARKKGADSREFGALEVQVKELQSREEFKRALDLLVEAGNRRGADWQSMLEKKTREVREAARGLYPGLKEKALDARRRDAGAEVKVVEDRVAKWGLDDLAADLREALAAVTPALPAPRAFQQSAEGLVVFEAENFSSKADVGGMAWTPVTAPAGFAGTGAMQSLPNANANIPSDFVTKSPRLDFRVNFVKTGTHYVWVRASGEADSDDSFHMGFDGAPVDTLTYMGFKAQKKWVWANKIKDGREAKFEVPTAGVHTVNLWMREDGAAVDRILITTQAKSPVSGTGPPESGR